MSETDDELYRRLWKEKQAQMALENAACARDIENWLWQTPTEAAAEFPDPPDSIAEPWYVGNTDARGKPDGRMFSRTPPSWIQQRMRENAEQAATEVLTNEEKARRQETQEFYRSYAKTVPRQDASQDRGGEREGGIDADGSSRADASGDPARSPGIET